MSESPIYEGILQTARSEADRLLSKARKEADEILEEARHKAEKACEEERRNTSIRLDAIRTREENAERSYERARELKSNDAAYEAVMARVDVLFDDFFRSPGARDVIVRWIAEAAYGLGLSEAKVQHDVRQVVDRKMLDEAAELLEKSTGMRVALQLDDEHHVKGWGVQLASLEEDYSGKHMQGRIIGQVKRVNGPVLQVKGITDAAMMELVHVGEGQIVGEIVKLSGTTATVQVYEDATGIAPGDNVYGSGMSLSCELGPGLIGNIYDGIQRPLEELRRLSGDFIGKGISASAVDEKRLWHFTPVASVGDTLSRGDVIGEVDETSRVKHRIMVPSSLEGEWTLISIVDEGDYDVRHEIAVIEQEGRQQKLTMVQYHPIRVPRPIRDRMALDVPLITGLRVIDSLFPLAKGGTVAIPGGFGTGKTMTQHSVAQWCDADIIVYIGCGERGNEMTDVLREFPHLVDPRTGKSLMERTILIANTSNMPVSAREASIYTGITMAEYYRDMGYNVAIMADSTSRWAEALRELSGRMEEMPAEEGFPAYLATRIAQFYERAGHVRTLCGEEGSVSIIGAVSPPGGDFSEPVTQHTRRFVRCFWGLDRSLASARHYPAISWLDSYSEYADELKSWWDDKSQGKWSRNRARIMELLQKETRLQQIVKLVGADALPDSQNFILEVCTLFKNAFLQQNAFDEIDRYCSPEKQIAMMDLILTYYDEGSQAIAKGVPMVKIRRLSVVQEMARMRFNVSNDRIEEIDRLALKLHRSITQLGGLYED